MTSFVAKMSDSEDNVNLPPQKKGRLSAVKLEESIHTEGSGDEIVSAECYYKVLCVLMNNILRTMGGFPKLRCQENSDSIRHPPAFVCGLVPAGTLIGKVGTHVF